jgi:AP-5 complex subunit mu-1
MSSTQVKILIQLKLSDAVPNHFDFCEVEVPFPTRGNIRGFELQPTAGTVHIDSRRKNSLIWNIGTKFPNRSTELALPGTVVFADDAVPPLLLSTAAVTVTSTHTKPPAQPQGFISNASNSPYYLDQLRCPDAAGFIRLRFRVPDWTASGAMSSPSSLFLFPNPSSKQVAFISTKATDTAEYIIWNSLGLVRNALHPEREQQNPHDVQANNHFPATAQTPDDSGASSSDVDSD